MADVQRSGVKPVEGCPLCDSWAWYVTLISDQDGNRISLGCTTPECPGERYLLIDTEVTVL